MKKQRSDALKTRLNLLEAAGEVFAEKGFWNATHEDICSKANANTAAINLSFRQQGESLCRGMEILIRKINGKYPSEGGADSKDPVEKRLRGRVLSILKRIADPETHEIDIMLKEMANPTGLLTEVITSKTEPIKVSSI